MLTSHSFTGSQNWFAHTLGTPNVVNHSSTCNSASSLARRMVFGPNTAGVAAVDPDYAHVNYMSVPTFCRFYGSVHRPCKSKERLNFPITHCRIYI